MTTNNNSQYFSWLLNEIDDWRSYHNHKETMSWLATTFYIAGILFLAFNIDKLGNLYPFQPVVILILFILVGLFVRQQFCLRSQAADEADSLRRALNDLINRTEGLKRCDTVIARGSRYPKFIQLEVDKRIPVRSIWSFLFTDLVCYLAIIFSTAVALCF